MPVSLTNRCIFVHIPKTAGSSIVQALHESDPQALYAGTGLWDVFVNHPRSAELVDRYRRTFRIGTLATAPQQHLPAAILRELVDPRVWNASFKFAFVRNPWDMLVSGYHYQTRTLSHEQRMLNPDAHELLRRAKDFADVVRYYPMIRGDMTSFLADESGDVIVDFVGRYESLAQDFAYVCQHIGISAELPHENRSEHASYREYYTDETRGIVERHFARDIERFNYTF